MSVDFSKATAENKGDRLVVGPLRARRIESIDRSGQPTYASNTYRVEVESRFGKFRASVYRLRKGESDSLQTRATGPRAFHAFRAAVQGFGAPAEARELEERLSFALSEFEDWSG